MVPGAIYVRQSVTREGSESMDIQRQACLDAAPRLGIEVVAEFIEDRSTSGYKNRGRSRPQFQALLRALGDGTVRAVVVYKSERLSRGGGPGWAPVFDALEAAGLDPGHAIATPNGWMSEFEIGIRATMDREESKKLSDRMLDVRAREAKEGEPRQGGRRPYGYERDLITVNRKEADRIREAARRVMAGESAWAVAESWNAQGLPGPGGGHWAAQTLKRILRSGRIAGIRETGGSPAGEAKWEPILDRGTWEAARAALDANRSRRPQRGSIPRTFLLSGILICGRCESTLWGRTRNSGRREYACANAQTHRKQSCGRLVIHADPVDADVFDVVAESLYDPDHLLRLRAAAPSESGVPDLGAEIADVERRQELLLDAYMAEKVKRPSFMRRSDTLAAELDALHARLTVASARSVATSLPPTYEAFSALWASEATTLEWRRLVVRLVVEDVRVVPGRADKPADRLRYSLFP